MVSWEEIMKSLLMQAGALATFYSGLWAAMSALPLALAAVSSSLGAQGGAANAATEALALDRTFLQGIERGESAAFERVADADFTWIEPRGVSIAREDALKAFAAGRGPKPALSTGGDVRIENRAYGSQLAVILRHQDKTHSMNVWVRRPVGWRLLSIIEVIEFASVPYGGTTINATCTNPCTTVPFFAANATQQAIMEGWQEQQTGPEGWLRRVAEDNVGYSTNGTRTRASRIAVMNQQRASGASIAAPALIWARIWDFDDAALMLSIQQGVNAKPVWSSRVFSNQSGLWQMVEAFQTYVQDGVVLAPR
jgi:hypothetical protein